MMEVLLALFTQDSESAKMLRMSVDLLLLQPQPLVRLQFKALLPFKVLLRSRALPPPRVLLRFRAWHRSRVLPRSERGIGSECCIRPECGLRPIIIGGRRHMDLKHLRRSAYQMVNLGSASLVLPQQQRPPRPHRPLLLLVRLVQPLATQM